MLSLKLTVALAAALSLFSNAQIMATYTLSDNYDASNFARSFNFFSSSNGSDPTQGFVSYVNSDEAQSSLLAGKVQGTGNVYLGVGQNVTSGGLPSIRVTSNKSYNPGFLMIFSAAHLPNQTCGSWPALWLLGNAFGQLGESMAWPNAGEIDIIEGVNFQSTTISTLHTSDGCMASPSDDFTGNMTTSNCYIKAGNQPGNAGCSVTPQGTDAEKTFGNGFNVAGGGVYATEVTTDGITMWFFSKLSIPADILQNSPNPDPLTWPKPYAKFAGACNISNHFTALSIVLNTEICGSWAGDPDVWSAPQANGQPSCQAMTGAATCPQYVQDHPEAFENVYWEIESIRVYESATMTPSVVKREALLDETDKTVVAIAPIGVAAVSGAANTHGTASVSRIPLGGMAGFISFGLALLIV